MELYKSSEITVHKLNELRDENKKIQILDVREDTEREHAFIKGTIHMKLSEIASRYQELDKNKKDECCLIFHTAISDENGTDLRAVHQALCPEFIDFLRKKSTNNSKSLAR